MLNWHSPTSEYHVGISSKAINLCRENGRITIKYMISYNNTKIA